MILRMHRQQKQIYTMKENIKTLFVRSLMLKSRKQ